MDSIKALWGEAESEWGCRSAVIKGIDTFTASLLILQQKHTNIMAVLYPHPGKTVQRNIRKHLHKCYSCKQAQPAHWYKNICKTWSCMLSSCPVWCAKFNPGDEGFNQNTDFNLILGIQAAIPWCSNQNFPTIMLEDNFTNKCSDTATCTPQQRHWKVALGLYCEKQTHRHMKPEGFSWFNKWNHVRNKKKLKKEIVSFFQTI